MAAGMAAAWRAAMRMRLSIISKLFVALAFSLIQTGAAAPVVSSIPFEYR
jgi:hypothetical protein